MANNTNLVLQLLITARDQASGIIGNIKTQLAALAVAITGAFSIKEAANFEVALDAIRARSDETGPALDALIESAKVAAQTLGPQFGYSATQAAGGIKELIAAGFDGEEAVKALNGTLALAAMEGIEVSQAAVLMSDAIAQFGLTAADASNVADILAKSAGLVAATATDMGEALKYTGNSASQAGFSLTQTAAILDVLAKAGLRGSEAGTGLASVLGVLQNPAHAATKALLDMGATSLELSDVLDFIESRGLNAAEAISLFGEQGGRVLNTLLAQGGNDAIDEFGNKIKNTGRSAEETARIMKENLLGAFDRFWESLKRVGIELGTPKLEPFAKGLDNLTASLNTFASNDRIHVFQAAMAEGFSRIYNAARDLANNINWESVSAGASTAFSAIQEAVNTTLTSLQNIYASLTGRWPDAAELAGQATSQLVEVWGNLKLAADTAGNAISSFADGIREKLGGPTLDAVVKLAGLRDELDISKLSYDGFRKALDAGKNTQEAVADAWESLKGKLAGVSPAAKDAAAAYQKAQESLANGTGTQEQVKSAWEAMTVTLDKADPVTRAMTSAYERMTAALASGKTIQDAVTESHDQQAEAAKRVKDAEGQASQQALDSKTAWGELKATLAEFSSVTVPQVFQDLGAAVATLLTSIRDLANRVASWGNAIVDALLPAFEVVSGAVKALSSGVAALVGVFVPSMEGMKASGSAMGSALMVAFSGIAGLLTAMAAGAMAAAQGVLQLALEAGKLTGAVSDDQAKELQNRILKIGDAAGEMAAVSAKAFEFAGKSQEDFIAAITGSNAQMDAAKKAAQDAAKALGEGGLAQASGKAAEAQAALKGKAEALKAAIEKCKAEVKKLAEADLSSVDATTRLGEAQQKLEAMQGDLIQATYEYSSGLISSGEAADSAAVELGKYDKKVIEATPTLEKLKAEMLKTRDAMERTEEAHKNNTLAATADKSITEQLNEARAAAASALTVYRAAIDRQIEGEETALKTAERLRQTDESRIKAMGAVKDASIQLATIHGDEAKVAELLAEKKQEQVEQSKALVNAMTVEIVQAQRLADSLKLKYETLLKTNPLDKTAIENAKEGAIQAQAEADSKRNVVIETEAKIPVMEAEAGQAEIMAGPIGQLTRLYEEQAKEHQRGAEASGRYHDAQVTEAEGELRLAQIRGDAVAEQEAQIKLSDRQIEQAQDLANAAAIEAQDAANALEAKKLELAADDELTKADQEQLAAMEASTAAKADAANAAQQHADQMRDEAEAAAELAKEQEAAAETARQAAKAAGLISDAYNAAISSLAGLSDAAVAEFKRLRGEIVPTGDELDALRDKTEKLDAAVSRVGVADGMVKFLTKIAADSNTVTKAFLGQAEAAERLTEQLNKVGEAGGATGGALETLIRQAENSGEQFALLDQARLDNLQSAIESANDKLRAMQDETQSAQDRLTELNAERLQAQGQDQKAELLRQQLDYQQQLAEIENQRQTAELTGNRDLLAILTEQKQVLEDINAAKVSNITAEAATPPRSTTSTSAGSGGGLQQTFNINVDGKDLLSEDQIRNKIMPVLARATRLNA